MSRVRMSITRTAFLVQKEFRQIFRDRGMLRIIFIMPMIQLFVLSYAVTTDLRRVRVAVLDEDLSESSRKLVASFFTSDLFVLEETAQTPSQLQTAVESGRVDLTIWIPVHYERDLVTTGDARVAIAADGQNSSLAGRALGYSEAIIRMQAQERLNELKDSKPQFAANLRRIEAVTRFYYNPELISRFYMIPGIVVLLLTVVSGMLTGMAIVKEKEIGTLDQLLVSPLSSGEIIAGKLIPFVVLAYAELSIATGVAVLWFDLPLEGSIGLLAFSAFCYLVVTLGGGLLASTVSHTQQQAMLTVWFFLVFGILTSGFFYPIDNMPRWIQYLTYANPMRYFLAIVRGLFLKGTEFYDLLPNLLPLVGIGIALFSLAVWRFRSRLS